MNAMFFAVLAGIAAVCWLAGRLARRFGQSPAVGHMLAGIALGPSVLGWTSASPQVVALLKPAGSLGVLVYMFSVGLEFDGAQLRSGLKSAWAVSAAGIAVPFALGGALALVYCGDPGLFSPKTGRFGAIVFCGAALSITAFPILARILDELGATQTRAGRLALAAGCCDDVAAAFLLTFVMAINGAGQVLGGPAACFAAGVFCRRFPSVRAAGEKAGPLAASLLLPLFFSWSGLNTRLDLLGAGGYLVPAVAFFLASCGGKLGGCYAAARWAGETRRDALAVGVLMNARALMELIVINFGLQTGVIEPALFSILAVMAVGTTVMTAPLARRVLAQPARAKAPSAVPA